jgi:hypothetical protein
MMPIMIPAAAVAYRHRHCLKALSLSAASVATIMIQTRWGRRVAPRRWRSRRRPARPRQA